MIYARTSDGHTWYLKTPEGFTLEKVQQHLVNHPDTWPESLRENWFINPTHIIAIREVKE